MNHRLPIFLVLLALPATADDPPPSPVAPVLRRAPDHCAWTIHHKQDYPAQEDSWEQAFAQETSPVTGDATVSETRHVKRRKVEKNAPLKTYRLSTSWSDGTTQEDWLVMGHHVAERAGGRGLYVAGAESTLGAEMSASDFPELAWLDLRHYRGLKTHNGRPVFVFEVGFNEKPMSIADRRYYNFVRQGNPQATPKEVFKPRHDRVVAYLDARSQLPILYNDGFVLRRYTFSTTRSNLRPPQKIIDFLRQREATLRIRTATPAGPAPAK